MRIRTSDVPFLQHHPVTRDAGRRKGSAPMTPATLSNDIEPAVVRTGPSFAAALCGFVSTTVATTMLLMLIGAF
ncbi:hypothetical protein PQI07_05910 [Methylobacterium sp. 092160098-2]|nr:MULTISPECIES: hypothetical protein [Methylobacterium]MBA9060890.1 hypothetical protein [Methylobacterium fujisawaense]MDE4910235.1 hypothetical protein [Methylobacterium sp. 092160098-2]MDH3028515.1 hypothetical protein [Methylobacterium fujisawaense]WFS07403.1 hypothetical protein P9K36_29285 [Methylobacterium sp. 391_Methyba4]